MLVDGVADLPLEGPECLVVGLALGDVGSARGALPAFPLVGFPGPPAEPAVNIMLLPVPSSSAVNTRSSPDGPYVPYTRSSFTPPVIFIPVCRETSRRIWFRLELSALIASCPSE